MEEKRRRRDREKSERDCKVWTCSHRDRMRCKNTRLIRGGGTRQTSDPAK